MIRPKVHMISLAHMDPSTVAASLMQFHKTCLDQEADQDADLWRGEAERVVRYLVDHHWPIEKETASWLLRKLLRSPADSIGGLVDTILSPPQNYGGTGGFNYALNVIRDRLAPGDFLLWYDPDSWPVTPGWLTAMYDVMIAQPKVATLSLWCPHEMQGRDDWQETSIAGHRVRMFDRAEAFSVTMWRADFALPKVEAEFEFYGQIEAPAYSKARSLGLVNAWLADFWEQTCPIPHPPVYEAWKRAHIARTFNGNFSEYYAETLKGAV